VVRLPFGFQPGRSSSLVVVMSSSWVSWSLVVSSSSAELWLATSSSMLPASLMVMSWSSSKVVLSSLVGSWT
jgi:hypothetical protein